jgi:hypothetical protein
MKRFRRGQRWAAAVIALLCIVLLAFWQRQAVARLAIITGARTLGRTASADVSRRFARLGAVDAATQRDVAAQLSALQSSRATVYREILAQIQSAAQAVARERHLATVKLVNAPQRGGSNLTSAVGSRLAS